MRIPSQLRHLMALLFLALGFCAPLHAQLGHEWQRLPDMPANPGAPFYYQHRLLNITEETTQTIVWSSADGRQWQRIETGLLGSPFLAFEFNNRLWLPVIEYNYVMDGIDRVSLYSCTTPTSWSLESILPTNVVQTYVVPFHGKLLLYSDEGIFSSINGKSWLQVLEGDSLFGQPQVFADMIWRYLPGGPMTGSMDGITFDIKYSTPFNAHGPPIPCGERFMFLQTTENYSGAEKRGIWESLDGMQWNVVSPTAPFTYGTDFALAYGNGGLWVLGGYPASSTWDRSVWFSPETVPQLQWEPGFCYFGNVMLNGPAPVQSVQLYNSTGQTVHFGSANFIGADATSFGFAQPPDLSPLSAHTTRTLQLKFDPSATGYQWATLRLTTDVTSETTRTFTLAGTGIADAPVPSLLPTTVDFGSRLPDTGPSEPKYLTLRNDGPATLTLSKYTFGYPFSADFALQNADLSPLAPYASRAVAVQFWPTLHFGLRKSTLALSHNAGSSSVVLTGRSGPPGHWQGLDWQLVTGNLAVLNDWFVSVVRFNQQYYTVMRSMVYRSSNLQDWSNAETSTPLKSPVPPIAFIHPALAVFQDKLWLFNAGGWTSTDGLNWTTLTLPTAMTTMHSSLIVNFNQRLWLLGGLRNSQAINEIWSTSDGMNWDGPTTGPVRALAMTSAAASAGANLVWATRNQMWCSKDGLDWQQVGFFNGLLTDYPSMDFHQGYLWLTDYRGAKGYAFWRSANGKDWEWVADSTAMPSRTGASLVSDGNSLYFFGGGTLGRVGSYTQAQDLWVSTPSANAVGAWACYQ